MNKLGPGIWWQIMSGAKRATTPESTAKFEEYLSNTLHDLPCQKICARDAWSWLAGNPISGARDIVDLNGNHIGIFEHMWKMFNYVNRKLGKPEFSFDDAYEMHYGRDVYTDILPDIKPQQYEEEDCGKCGGPDL
jgi:hypothetical protein